MSVRKFQLALYCIISYFITTGRITVLQLPTIFNSFKRVKFLGISSFAELIQFNSSYLRENVTSQKPITKLERVRERKNKTKNTKRGSLYSNSNNNINSVSLFKYLPTACGLYQANNDRIPI
jgi:hypothetical protein